MHRSTLTDNVTIALVGCGGNGSQMLHGLAKLDRALIALGHPYGLNVVVFDDDTVSEANLGRQLFFPQDVGKSKAEVLVTRVNMCFGTNWKAVAKRFEPGLREAVALSPAGYHRNGKQSLIVIGAVDSKSSRQAIHAYTRDIAPCSYWLDLGNGEDNGQVVIGQPLYRDTKDWHMRLPTVVELFKELLNDEPEPDDGPSCSLAEALERQSLFINPACSVHALQLLWLLFRHGELDHSAEFINMRSGRVTPLPVDADAWKRMGHKTKPLPRVRQKKATS